MTAMRYATVWCDGSMTADRMSCGEYVEGDTAADARRNAKAQGWVVGVPDPETRMSRDFCPADRPEQ